MSSVNHGIVQNLIDCTVAVTHFVRSFLVVSLYHSIQYTAPATVDSDMLTIMIIRATTIFLEIRKLRDWIMLWHA